MPLTSDLTGLGMAPGLASLLGNTPASISGNGTSQANGRKIGGTALNLVTPSGGATAFTLLKPLHTGTPIWVFNVSASTAALIFPPSGGKINGGSTDASISIAANKGAVLMLGSGAGISAELWYAILSA